MDNNSLKALLNKYFTQKVIVPQDEKRKALNVWEDRVRKILQRVQEKDPRFKLNEIMYSGSYYERAKVKEPNEFDLMLEIEKLKLGGGDQYDSHEDNLSTDPPLGYTTVLIDQGEEISWRRDGCIPRNGNLLSSINIRSLFCRYVHEAVTRLGYVDCIEVTTSGPAVTLKIAASKEYSIDLTLAIKDESWPDDADEWKTRRRGWPPRHLVDEIVRDGCHLVPKRPRQAFTAESEYFWCYSFFGAEKKLAIQGEQGEEGTCRKKILRILKSLREEHDLTPLSSYHLKTIMFYEREETTSLSSWKEDQLAVRFKSALARLLRCLQAKRCPHYFMKDVDLFDSRFDKCYQTLITRIVGIQNYPQKYLKVS